VMNFNDVIKDSPEYEVNRLVELFIPLLKP
jgi:hypothetical protein